MIRTFIYLSSVCEASAKVNTNFVLPPMNMIPLPFDAQRSSSRLFLFITSESYYQNEIVRHQDLMCGVFASPRPKIGYTHNKFTAIMRGSSLRGPDWRETGTEIKN